MATKPTRNLRVSRPWFLPRILFIECAAIPSFLRRKMGFK